jgi:proline dehydrogenase
MPVQLPVREQEVLNAEGTPNELLVPSLVDSLPLPLVLWLASPYLAGKNLGDAMRRAHELWQTQRYSATIDILGEDCTKESECDYFVEAYRQAVDAITEKPVPVKAPQEQVTISIKPSMFSVAVPDDPSPETANLLSEAYYRMKTVVEYAKIHGVKVTIEAEDHRWTDFHLNSYFSLRKEGFDNVGTVLQSRLFRTANDIKRFGEGDRTRLVIGIYNEPKDIAETNISAMKERLIDYAAELAARGVYVELATHDEVCLNMFMTRVVLPQKLGRDRFETQWLLGVPRKDVQQALVSGTYFSTLAAAASSDSLEHLSDLARSGIVVRMYLPFGKDHVAGPYCKRRLKGNPHMISYGIKNALNIR